MGASMTDFQDTRARIRDTGYQPEPSGGGRLLFWIVTVCAVAVGFTVVLFVPRFYTVQRTAALPALEVVDRESGAPAQTAATSEVAANPARYAGKSAEEIAKIADSICASGSPIGPTSIADQSERLHCLLIEAPARYCAPIQRSKITAAIINHFRIVERAAKPARIEVEPRVLVAIEGLMRAGYLLKPQRDDIGASVPREIKERFARIVANKAPCAEPPWWAAIWK